MRQLLMIGLLVLIPQLVTARTWYVTPDGTGDAPTIQAGLDLTSPGDTVVLACGHYYEHSIDMRPGVCLRSETGAPECAIIDAQNEMVIFACWGTDGDGAVIQGITFYQGYAPVRDYPDGAGVQCLSCSPVFADCVFQSNEASNYGGGLLCGWGSPSILDCAFIGNAAVKGGAIACYDSDPQIEDCIFRGNNARRTDGLYYGTGGAIFCRQSSPVIRNCTFFSNSGWSAGSAVFCLEGSSPILENCIIAASRRTEAISCADPASLPVLRCSDIYGNAGGDWIGCIADLYGVDGNISADPLFCDTLGRDFRLQTCSPCLPGNHPDGYDCGVPIGAYCSGCACHTATEPTTWGAIKSMYR